MGKRVLVIGSGGREHALCWKLAQSPAIDALFCAPGNAGIGQVARCVILATQADIAAFCARERIDLVVIGPEQPLVEGLADRLRAEGIPVFGPGALAARLEGSKDFMKSLCRKYGLATAEYESFTEKTSALAYAAKQSFPLVIKADGLAAGKGVIIAENLPQAEQAITEMFSGAFGAAGNTVVIEEFLEGQEVSFFALCDGRDVLAFGAAQDHKRAFDGDTGPNTGGMGTYSPPPIFTSMLQAEVMETLIRPTAAAMAAEGCPFQGVLFAGLMLTKEGAKLLEYNARFGDPETQVLMRQLESDLLPLLEACAHGTLADVEVPRMKAGASVCVVMAAKGYPGVYDKGSIISGLELASAQAETVVFHAGTAQADGQIVASGGRVLGITAHGKSITEAKSRAYAAVDCVDWPQGFCRRDIAWQASES